MDNLRRRIILAAASTPAPERIPYIRGGGEGSEPYIDTGIIPDNNTRIIVWARNWVPYGGFMLGSRTSASVDEFELCAPDVDAVDRARFKFATNEVYVNGAIMRYFSNYHKYEINGNQFFIDDVLKAETLDDQLVSSFSIHLFGLNHGGEHWGSRYPIDIMACKIYQNNVLVRDFTPVQTPYVGFYDSVTDTVYGNPGGGELTYHMYDPHAYKPIKYVTSTSEQYIDTGIIGRYSSSFVTQVASKASTPKWNIPVSARYSTQKRCEYFFGNTAITNYNISAGYSGQTNQISADGFYGAKLSLTKSGNTFTAYKSNVLLGAKKTFNSNTAYTTNQSFIIGGTFENGAFLPSESFEGDMYYVGIGKDGNYVPALIGGVAGFYDTYNDRFYKSETDSPFIAGPDFDDNDEAKTIPYIRGGKDGSYIDTGIIPDSSTSITVWARNFNPESSAYTWFFGSRVSSTDSCFDVYADKSPNTGKIGAVYANNGPIGIVNWNYFTDYHKYELKQGSLFVDGEYVVGKSSGHTFSTSLPIHLIGLNNNGSHIDSNMRIDICACQIYKNGVLVRDFTPKQENGVIGLYDSVSNMLFTNAGTGNFEYGTFNTKAYTRLEYITASGDSYFDSGVYGKYTDDFTVRYVATSRTPRWHALFGCRPAANSFEIDFGRDTDSQDNRTIYWRMGPSSGSTYTRTIEPGTSFTGKEVVIVKDKNSAAATVIANGTRYNANITGVSSTFVSNLTLGVGAIKSDVGSIYYSNTFYGRLYYLRLGMERSFVPAIVNNVVGMYDTFNDQFYASITNTPFIAGPPLIV